MRRHFQIVYAVAVIIALVMLAVAFMYNGKKSYQEKRFSKNYVVLEDFSSDPPVFAYYYRAKVVNVVDGDTVDMIVYLGYNISMVRRFRLFGINAPEMTGSSRFDGQSSKEYLKKMIEGKEVIVRSIDDRIDKYGRQLGVVFVNGVKPNVNAKMLQSGHAVEMGDF